MNEILSKDFELVVKNIKEDIKSTQIKVTREANSELIMLYFRIGKVLDENSKYGNSFIQKISKSISLEYPGIKGFSERNLKYMKKFYLEYKDTFEKVQQLVAKLPWGHNVLLMEKIKDVSVRKIYMKATIENGWSRNVLDLQIQSNYHLR